MSDNPFADAQLVSSGGRSGGKALFVAGGVLLAGAAGCLVAVSVLLSRAGANAEPGAPGLIPGQSQVLGPVAVLVVITMAAFMAGVFALMIGAKRLMRSAREEREAAPRATARLD